MTVVLGALMVAGVMLMVPVRARLPPSPATRDAPRRPAPLWVVGVAAVLGLLVAGLPGERVLLVLIASASGADVVRRTVRRRRRTAASARTAAVLTACDGLAADLRAGLPPVRALDAAADAWVELAPVARSARFGGDVPESLRALASHPGAGSLRVLAAAWQVSERSGAGMAAALELAGRMLREDRAVAEVVGTELAAARATAVLLGVLPVGVLLLGTGFGGDPFGFLLGTLPGLVCLALGLALVHAGLAWLDLIATSVER